MLADVAVRVEDVVDDLEQEPELLGERAPRRLLRLGQLRRPERHRHRRVEEPPGLEPVDGGEVVALDHRVEVLAADHPERRLRELARDRRRLVARREPHGLREQRVAGEHRRALAELLPRGRIAAPLLVVVHPRQVVVDERERVDELDRERRRHDLVDRRAERLADRERDDRADALAADLERVAHGRRLAVQLGPELEPLERLLDERLQLVGAVHPPPSARCALLELLLDRLRELRELAEQLDRAAPASRRRSADSCSSSARAASSRASSSSALRQRLVVISRPPAQPSRGFRSPACRVLGCIPLRERHRLVEDDLDRHLALVELLERDAEDVPLDGAEPVGRPVVGGVGDARVELLRVRGDGLREALACTRRPRRRRASRAVGR